MPVPHRWIAGAFVAANGFAWASPAIAALGVPATDTPPGPPPAFVQRLPLVPPSTAWTFNEYWHGRRIGPRDFYLAGQGPYQWLSEEGVRALREVGLHEGFIPGHLNFPFIKYLLPEERAKLAPEAPLRRMIESLIQNRWPIHTIFYCRFQGNPPPDQRLREALGEQWIGDGQPEQAYRLEPVFHYLKTGRRWVGSSMHLWNETEAVKFFKNDLLPRLEQAFPFLHDPGHQWTRPELRRLADLYCEEFYRPVGRVLDFAMLVGSRHLASLPSTIAVGEKGADAFAAARIRGLARQFGGSKFQAVWRGHEPTEMYAYFKRAWYSLRGDEWGLPLPHIWYYIYRPYLIGANYYVNEGFPGSCIQDVEADGQLELSTLGYIVKDLLDFIGRHPERGIVYAPVALLLDYHRAVPRHGTSFAGYNLPSDDADFFNEALFEAVFPEHRHAPGAGYSRTAPLGEIFDLLQPNVPGRGADPRALANYKVLLALAGLTFDPDLTAKVREHVRAGGTLVLHAADITPPLTPDFLGLELRPELIPGGPVLCTLDGDIMRESPYALHAVRLTGAEAVFRDEAGRPVLTRHRFGQGHVFVLLAHYGVEKDGRRVAPAGGFAYWRKDLLKCVMHFLRHLTVGVTPIEVLCRPEDEPDLSWIVARKGDGWVVTLFNYSCAREPIVVQPGGTGKVHARYPLREVPFQIVCRAPTADVLEWHADRDVNWETVDGRAIISETLHGGEIRVYELQPRPIDLGPRTRYVNYALHRPVKASSFMKGYEPERAFNGCRDRYDQWWSDTDPKRHDVFELPQWLEVDLGQVRTIDHLFVLLPYWEHESLQTRLHIYKYIVEASADGRTWQRVMDESRNEDNARPEGTERWFAPVPARYVRLTVLQNSAFSGAGVIELEVMGQDKETFQPVRRRLTPDWEVQYPAAVRAIPSSRITYLIDLKPVRAKPGWLPAGNTWTDLCGDVKLMTTRTGLGRFYPKSLYAQAVSEYVYALDGRYETFVAAIGLGAPKEDASVEFQVYVDGRRAYSSGLYRLGRPVLPVVVDVAGARELRLVVTDGGDGITNDYAWWGEARLVRQGP